MLCCLWFDNLLILSLLAFCSWICLDFFYAYLFFCCCFCFGAAVKCLQLLLLLLLLLFATVVVVAAATSLVSVAVMLHLLAVLSPFLPSTGAAPSSYILCLSFYALYILYISLSLSPCPLACPFWGTVVPFKLIWCSVWTRTRLWQQLSALKTKRQRVQATT